MWQMNEERECVWVCMCVHVCRYVTYSWGSEARKAPVDSTLNSAWNVHPSGYHSQAPTHRPHLDSDRLGKGVLFGIEWYNKYDTSEWVSGWVSEPVWGFYIHIVQRAEIKLSEDQTLSLSHSICLLSIYSSTFPIKSLLHIYKHKKTTATSISHTC